jgi:hypothetical protein
VICSVHLPFYQVVLRHLAEAGARPTVVVAGEHIITNGEAHIWGTKLGFPALVADGNVLLKARGILRKGGSVFVLVGGSDPSEMNMNVFRFVRSVHARLVFFTVEMQPDGEIMIEFFSPPDPLCLSDESVLSNLLALQDRIVRILQLPTQEPGNSTTAVPEGSCTNPSREFGAGSRF